MAVTVIGVGSNLLVRDGGIPGVTIRLGRPFAAIGCSGTQIQAGAAAMDVTVAREGRRAGVSGLEFLSLSAIAPFSSEAGLSPNIHGLALFLEIVAFLSVSLGLLNFLPIPGLDGGKLTFILIEWARGGARASPGNGS